MTASEMAFPASERPARLLQWKIAGDTMVTTGRILFIYKNLTPDGSDTCGPEKKFRASQFGRIVELLLKPGDRIHPGDPVVTFEGCQHPTIMKDLCAECGIDLRQESSGNKNNLPTRASVPMVHSIPELKVTPELAEKIGKEDIERLLHDKKLALLVDLDQTLVHTTNDNVPVNMKDVYHYQLYGPHSPWYHTRLRPNTRHFLLEMSKYYELHICTFGARNYAHKVASLLDTDGVLFSHRILSRDECFDPLSKTANLKALFPCGDDMVCIIDDREDVWQGCGNVVQVKPYHFFRHTGDINAPPGLEKNEDVSRRPDLLEIETEAERDSNIENGEVPLVTENEKVKDGKSECMELDENTEEKLDERLGQKSDNNEEEKVSKKVEETTKVEKLEEKKTEEVETNKSEEVEEIKSKDAEVKIPEEAENKKSEDLEEKLTDDISKQKSTKQASENSKDSKEESVEKFDEEGQQTEEKDEEKLDNREDIVDEDVDDYLLYLEDILKRIHQEFYKDLDKETGKRSLRDVIPKVREKVLKGVNITFSGLTTTHQKLEQSRAYRIARSFGAQVQQELSDETTHLVAVRPGTVKVYMAKKNSKIKIVNPEWLWTCAERWEHVDERLFPVSSKARGSRIPPPHCSNPERMEEERRHIENSKESFANSINPLLSFSREEIDNMDKEVDEDMEELDEENDEIEENEGGNSDDFLGSEGDDENDDDFSNKRRFSDTLTLRKAKKRKINASSTSSESLDDEDNDDDDDDDDENDEDDDDDDPLTRFRRGESLPEDLDLGDPSSQPSVGELENDDLEDDQEWNAMGAALEREFLSE